MRKLETKSVREVIKLLCDGHSFHTERGGKMYFSENELQHRGNDAASPLIREADGYPYAITGAIFEYGDWYYDE